MKIDILNKTKTFFFLLTVAISHFSLGQSDYGKISGKVFDNDTKVSLDYAEVVLKLDNKVVTTRITDENGKFTFNGIETGIYELEVYYPGYSKVFIKDINVLSQGVYNFLIYLKLENIMISRACGISPPSLIDASSTILSFNSDFLLKFR